MTDIPIVEGLTAVSWLLLAIGAGLVLVWILRPIGTPSAATAGQRATPLAGGLMALAVGIAGVSVSASGALPSTGTASLRASQA